MRNYELIHNHNLAKTNFKGIANLINILIFNFN